MMQRVIAPGLPSTPRLYFDKAARRAKVSIRHPTWQGEERALYATEVILWCSAGFAGWHLWEKWQLHHHPEACFVVAPAFTIMALLAGAILRDALRGFLTRQVLASTTTFWFTADAIAFKSRLYDRPVVLWRRWKGRRVNVRFITGTDPNASSYGLGLDYRRTLPRKHIDESVRLQVLLGATGREGEVDQRGPDTSLRIIPVTEVNSSEATKFTMVWSAAAGLTVPDRRSPTNTPAGDAGGVDIDSA